MKYAVAAGLALLLLSATALADFDQDDWRWRAKLDTGNRSGLVNVEIDVASPLWEKAQPDLADLRIVDEAGEEVPYLLWRPEATAAGGRVQGALTNVGRTSGPNPSTTATLDFGDRAPALTGLVLEVGGPSRFMRPVILHGSQNQQDWTELSTPDYVYDLREQGGVRSTHIRISHPTTFRYIRVLIPDMGLEPVTIVSGTGDASTAAPVPLREVYAGKPSLSRVGEDKTSTHIVDLGAARPVREVSVTAGAQNFHRPVSIDGSNDNKTWHPLGTGVLYSYDLQGRAAANQPVRVEECICRYLRLTIRDGDDNPLPISTLTLKGLPASLLFDAKPGRQYYLYAGNLKAKRPTYEIARLPVTPQDAPVVRPGFAEQNPNYSGPVDGKPWTERYPWILWTALGLAVIAAGTGVVRIARDMRSGQSGGN